jgi:hypothetical protein
MLWYGNGADRDGALAIPGWGGEPWAKDADPDNIAFPSADMAKHGVEPLDTYPAKWFNYFGNYYSKQLIALVKFIADIYTELESVGDKLNEHPNRSPTIRQLGEWVDKIAKNNATASLEYLDDSKVRFTKAPTFGQITSGSTMKDLFGILSTWFEVITDQKATGLIPNLNGTPDPLPPDKFGYLWVDVPTNTVRCVAVINGVKTEIPLSGGGGKAYDPNDVVFEAYDPGTNKIMWTIPPEKDITAIIVIYITGESFYLAKDATSHIVDKSAFTDYPLTPRALIQIKDLDGYCSAGKEVEMRWQ